MFKVAFSIIAVTVTFFVGGPSSSPSFAQSPVSAETTQHSDYGAHFKRFEVDGKWYTLAAIGRPFPFNYPHANEVAKTLMQTAHHAVIDDYERFYRREIESGAIPQSFFDELRIKENPTIGDHMLLMIYPEGAPDKTVATISFAFPTNGRLPVDEAIVKTNPGWEPPPEEGKVSSKIPFIQRNGDIGHFFGYSGMRVEIKKLMAKPGWFPLLFHAAERMGLSIGSQEIQLHESQVRYPKGKVQTAIGDFRILHRFPSRYIARCHPKMLNYYRSLGLKKFMKYPQNGNDVVMHATRSEFVKIWTEHLRFRKGGDKTLSVGEFRDITYDVNYYHQIRLALEKQCFEKNVLQALKSAADRLK